MDVEEEIRKTEEEEPVKNRYDFFCRSTEWVRCYQGEMTEEEAIKHAKDTDMRFAEAM